MWSCINVKAYWPVMVVALLACWISIVTCLDPAGSYPSLPEGPGLTVDEIFNVQQGVILVKRTGEASGLAESRSWNIAGGISCPRKWLQL